MPKLIIINGVMGVGKTTISNELFRNLDKSVWLDGDWCWAMNPFVVNETTKKMVIANCTTQLNNFISSNQFDYIIFSWIIDKEEMYQEILSHLTGDFECIKITLLCTKETLVHRINDDIQKSRRTKSNIKSSLLKYDRYFYLDSIKIHTDNKSTNLIVEEIKDLIG